MASSMRRRDHPSFPSEITCCFLSVLKTLLMPSEPIRALSGVNVPGFPMAGFQLTLYGRFWATPEESSAAEDFAVPLLGDSFSCALQLWRLQKGDNGQPRYRLWAGLGL